MTLAKLKRDLETVRRALNLDQSEPLVVDYEAMTPEHKDFVMTAGHILVQLRKEGVNTLDEDEIPENWRQQLSEAEALLLSYMKPRSQIPYRSIH